MPDLTADQTSSLDMIACDIATGVSTQGSLVIHHGHGLLCAAKLSYHSPAMRYLMRAVEQRAEGSSVRFFPLDSIPGAAEIKSMCAAFAVVPADTPLIVLSQEEHADRITAYVVVATFSVHVQQR